jgi:hypothetical protein
MDGGVVVTGNPARLVGLGDYRPQRLALLV